jgi:hypothetical protein
MIIRGFDTDQERLYTQLFVWIGLAFAIVFGCLTVFAMVRNKWTTFVPVCLLLTCGNLFAFLKLFFRGDDNPEVMVSASSNALVGIDESSQFVKLSDGLSVLLITFPLALCTGMLIRMQKRSSVLLELLLAAATTIAVILMPTANESLLPLDRNRLLVTMAAYTYIVVFALLNALALDWMVLRGNLAPEGFPLTIYRLSIIVFGVYWLVDLVNFFFTAFEVAPLYDVFYLN